MACAEPKVWCFEVSVNASCLPSPPPPILVTSVAHREAFRVEAGKLGRGGKRTVVFQKRLLRRAFSVSEDLSHRW